jgi:hypothetical protein
MSLLPASGFLPPPPRNQPPAHRHELGSTTIGKPHHLDGVGRGDVVAGLQIAGGAGEVIQIVDFAPRVALGEASAHNAATYGKADAVTPLCRMSIQRIGSTAPCWG